MTALSALPSLAQNAANGRFEPKLTDAAQGLNGSNVPTPAIKRNMMC